MKDDHAAFVGSIPQYYDRILVPLIFAPCADDLVARVKPCAASRVLELACGTGSVTTRLAETLGPSARIMATDLNDAMLDVARLKQISGAAVTWQQADATALPFAARSFDAVVCQFGWMFFPDKARAMHEARRVLVPGGRLFYTVWDRIESCPVYDLANAAVHACFRADPPTFLQTPFGMSDPDVHRRLMADAGFTGVSIDVLAHTGAPMNAARMAEGIVRGGPLATEIEARKGDVAAVVRSIEERLEDRFGREPFTSPMKAVFCTGSAPS